MSKFVINPAPLEIEVGHGQICICNKLGIAQFLKLLREHNVEMSQLQDVKSPSKLIEILDIAIVIIRAATIGWRGFTDTKGNIVDFSKDTFGELLNGLQVNELSQFIDAIFSRVVPLDKIEATVEKEADELGN